MTSSISSSKRDQLIDFVALGGFLGSGKTTTILAAAEKLARAGRRVAVIANDQGSSLVDSKLFQSRLDAVGEVVGGCFCCRFDDLLGAIDDVLADGSFDVVIAEAVGSCTDLQATVLRPLRKEYADRFRVAPLTTIVDLQRLEGFDAAAERGEQQSDMSYLFAHQLAEADIIAVNKADLMSPDEHKDRVERLASRFPGAMVLGYSARTGDGVEALVNAWDQPPLSPIVDIEYDRYAAAEAELAWLNLTYDLRSSAGFSPERWGVAALEQLARDAAAAEWVVGHAKLAIEADGELTKMSITRGGATPSVDVPGPSEDVLHGTAYLNARIACEPDEMDAAAAAAVRSADAAAGVSSEPIDGEGGSFKPGYPTPTHRILEPVS
jgi:Ni2+-binding GTPase involved in maturation of urease and hydrogenase